MIGLEAHEPAIDILNIPCSQSRAKKIAVVIPGDGVNAQSGGKLRDESLDDRQRGAVIKFFVHDVAGEQHQIRGIDRQPGQKTVIRQVPTGLQMGVAQMQNSKALQERREMLNGYLEMVPFNIVA